MNESPHTPPVPGTAEAEGIRRLLLAAAESGGAVTSPGPAFVTRARRSRFRRRAAGAAAALCLLGGAAVLVPAVANGGSKQADEVPAASAQCLRDTAQALLSQESLGARPVYGTLREGRIHLSDRQGSSGTGLLFDIEGALTAGSGAVPTGGSAKVWAPASAASVPEPGRYVLLLRPAPAELRDGGSAFGMNASHVFRVEGDRVHVDCSDKADGEKQERAVTLSRLRAALGRQ